MTDHAARAYDELFVAQQLEQMGARQRTLFSVACSQILWSTYCTIAAETGDERPPILDEALADLWSIAKGHRGTDGITELDPLVADAVPHDDSEAWVDSSGFLQSAGIALLNTIDGVATGRLRRPVFAARQISEIAEYIVSLAEDDADGESVVGAEGVCDHAKNLVHRQLDIAARWRADDVLDVDGVLDGCRRDGEELGSIALRLIDFRS